MSQTRFPYFPLFRQQREETPEQKSLEELSLSLSIYFYQKIVASRTQPYRMGSHIQYVQK